jgi:hypothetical protein
MQMRARFAAARTADALELEQAQLGLVLKSPALQTSRCSGSTRRGRRWR